MKINFENINKYVRNFKNEKELLEFIKDKIDFLYRNNNNWRRKRVSNPRWFYPLSVFETDPFNHLGISPY